MKLDFDQSSSALSIFGYSHDGIRIGERTLSEPFVVHETDIHINLLPKSCTALGESHIRTVLALDVDIVLIGTGSRQVFLDPAVLRPALESGVGVETMQTGAACRSYNVLVAEGRSVAGLFYPLK